MTCRPSRRVMIVDDDRVICRSLARILRSYGHEVETASDGLTAVALADTFRPHLTILDVRMPGIDGIETYRRIREQNPAIDGILMSAYPGDAAEPVTWMSKPLDVGALISRLDDVSDEE